MKKLIIILIAALSISACSPTRKLERLLKRYPQLTAIDTAYITHSTTIPEMNYRAMHPAISIGQSLKVELPDKTQILITNTGDSTEIQAYRPQEIIEETIAVPHEKIQIIRPSSWHLFLKRLPWFVILVIVIKAFYWYYKKRPGVL